MYASIFSLPITSQASLVYYTVFLIETFFFFYLKQVVVERTVTCSMGVNELEFAILRDNISIKLMNIKC